MVRQTGTRRASTLEKGEGLGLLCTPEKWVLRKRCGRGSRPHNWVHYWHGCPHNSVGRRCFCACRVISRCLQHRKRESDYRNIFIPAANGDKKMQRPDGMVVDGHNSIGNEAPVGSWDIGRLVLAGAPPDELMDAMRGRFGQ